MILEVWSTMVFTAWGMYTVTFLGTLSSSAVLFAGVLFAGVLLLGVVLPQAAMPNTNTRASRTAKIFFICFLLESF